MTLRVTVRLAAPILVLAVAGCEPKFYHDIERSSAPLPARGPAAAPAAAPTEAYPEVARADAGPVPAAGGVHQR